MAVPSRLITRDGGILNQALITVKKAIRDVPATLLIA
jgi:hypothetical protein